MPSRVATSASDRPSPFSCAAFCICGVSVMLTPFTIDRTAGSGTNPTPCDQSPRIPRYRSARQPSAGTGDLLWLRGSALTRTGAGCQPGHCLMTVAALCRKAYDGAAPSARHDAARRSAAGGRVHAARPGVAMYSVIRQYRAQPTAINEVVDRAREGFVPLIKASPGFVSYVLVDAGKGRALTVSTF